MLFNVFLKLYGFIELYFIMCRNIIYFKSIILGFVFMIFINNVMNIREYLSIVMDIV